MNGCGVNLKFVEISLFLISAMLDTVENYLYVFCMGLLEFNVRLGVKVKLYIKNWVLLFDELALNSTLNGLIQNK